MADKSFGVKQLNLIGPSGTPTITSPNNLNVNAVTVAISTDVSIGGQVTSNVIVGTGKSVGIGSTQPQANLTVNGTIQTRQINVTGVSTFAGIATVTGTTFTNQLNVSGISTFIGNVRFANSSGVSTYVHNIGPSYITGYDTSAGYQNDAYLNFSPVTSNYILRNVGIGTTNPTSALTVGGGTSIRNFYVTGISTFTGTIFTNQLVSSGVVTATSFSGSNTLKSRTIVSGATTSIVNNGIGNTDITGFKSYSLMKVGLSTAGWLRLYTDSASRSIDASRSIGIDPMPGSGVIAEVITTGISTTQIITPFVMGGNLDEPTSTTIYAAITNLSGVTTSISVNLTILQLEV